MTEGEPTLSELCIKAEWPDAPVEGMRAITALRARLEGVEQQRVAEMLDQGATWAAVAETLGISRQAAHRRFRDVRKPPPAPAPPSTQVNRILVTGVARATVTMAREEAAALGAPAVGTEHLLLALTRSAPEPVAYALRSVGIDEEALRATLQPTLVEGSQPAAGDSVLTAHAREVLEGSLQQAVKRGDGFIGPDHLLYALLENPSGGASQTLAALGATADDVIDALDAKLADPSPGAPDPLSTGP